MEQLTCTSCGLINLPGETVCRQCGAALVAPHFVAPGAGVAPPPDAVFVERGMGQSAKLLAALFTLVGLVVVGVLFYQWGRSDRSQDETARTRAERSDRPSSEPRPTTSRTEPPAPALVVTTPAPAPVAAPAVIVTTPAPSTAPTSGSVPPDAAGDRELARYTAAIDPLLEQWSDAIKTAETAEGPELTSAITTLRNVERKVSQVSPSAAAGRAHGHLVTAMTAMIDALEMAAQDQTDLVTSPTYMQAQRLFDQFEAEYTAQKATRS